MVPGRASVFRCHGAGDSEVSFDDVVQTPPAGTGYTARSKRSSLSRIALAGVAVSMETENKDGE